MSEAQRVAIVDCETTGLDSHDLPISIAVLLTTLDESGFGEIEDVWYGEQYPPVRISDGAFAVHGRTRESLVGKAFDFSDLTTALKSVRLVVAHNADFDARMISKVFPEIKRLHWHCSYRQWPFGKMPNQRLDTVCDYLEIEKPFKHDAMSDARRLYLALMQRQSETGGNTYLHRLLQNAAWISPQHERIHEEKSEAQAVRIHEFSREEMKFLPVGTKIKLEASPSSNSLVAYRIKDFSRRVPILSILKSENPHIAEKVGLGRLIFFVVTANDGARVDISFQAEEPAV